MNIKTLLIGSTAAFISAPAAQAADAIIIDPEPVEYVRVCDAYGSGFFYIPGTETCMSFSGFVRASYEKTYISDVRDGFTNTFFPVLQPSQSQTFWGTRARLNVDTRNETDWGTLRSQIRLEGGDSNTDADIAMDRALISLAGFRFGFSDNFWSTNHGYAWVNATGLGATGFGGFSDEGWYGFDDATLADYTWVRNGFAVTIGAEDPRISASNGAFGNVTNSGGTDGRVNFYAGLNYSAAWGQIAATAVHDSLAFDNQQFLGLASGSGGWAYKVSISLDLAEYIQGGALHAMYMWDGEENTSYVQNFLHMLDPSKMYQVAYAMALGKDVDMFAQYSRAEGDSFEGEGDSYSASVGINWYPVEQFSVRGSYSWGETNDTLGPLFGRHAGRL